MANTYLQRTAGTSTENYKYTFSAWVKRTGVIGASSLNEVLFSNWYDSTNSAYIRFEDANDNLHVFDKYGSTIDLNYQTNMKFRDSNAWYHIVVNVDGTRSANTRCKIYVNGSEVSCSNTTDTGGTLAMITVTATNAMRAGAIKTSGGAEYYFSGLMSHVHYIDGTGYDASYFGETDSTTGEWKIKTSPTGITYGNNGFFILKDGNSVTDQSGEGNNFTVGSGTLTNTEDNPSNVFATLNPLNVPTSNAPTFSNGNTQSVSSSSASGAFGGSSTIGVSSGKWYIEAKCLTSGHNQSSVGVTYNDAETARTNNGGTDSYEYSYRMNGNKGHDNTDSSYGNTYTTNDIIGVALDLDNNKIYFSKNGTFQNSGVPTSGATGTGAAFTVDSGQTYMFYHHDTTGASSNTSTFAFNFGNGYFGTTAVSSAGTNASGNGIFEYDVPTGYTALSTKGLNL